MDAAETGELNAGSARRGGTVRELSDFPAGPAEELDEHGPRDVEALGHCRVHRGVELHSLPADASQLAAHLPVQGDEARYDDERGEGDLPGQHEHDTEGRHQPEEISDDA